MRSTVLRCVHTAMPRAPEPGGGLWRNEARAPVVGCPLHGSLGKTNFRRHGIVTSTTIRLSGIRIFLVEIHGRRFRFQFRFAAWGSFYLCGQLFESHLTQGSGFGKDRFGSGTLNDGLQSADAEK